MNDYDVFVMSPETPGVNGLMTRWPQEVLDPPGFGKRYLLFTPGDYCNRGDGRFSRKLMPLSGGQPGWPVYYIGVPHLGDQDLNIISPPSAPPIEFPGTDLYGRSGAISANNIVMTGITFRFPVAIRNDISNVVIHRCHFDNIAAEPVRIRYSAQNIVISENLIQRILPFPHTSDVTGIQFVDNKSINCSVVNNTIVNYTDAIQTTHRVQADGSSNDYGLAEGLLIEGNDMGFTQEMRTTSGGLAEGCENVLDFKTGGTPLNPVIIRNNRMFGCRPNTRTPGYAVNIQNLATDLVFEDNLFYDNECGVFLNAQYVQNAQRYGWQNSRSVFINNTFVKIRNNNVAENMFSSKAGCVVAGLNVAAFINTTLIDVDKFAENPPSIEAGQMIIRGTRWLSKIDAPANFPPAGVSSPRR